jgi:hypothetical protein
MRVTPKLFLALTGACLLAACNDNNPVEISGDASGTYNLRLVGNQPPPYTFNQDATSTDRVTGGSFTVNSDSTYTQTLDFDNTTSGVTTTSSSTCTGTYSQSGGILTFFETTDASQNCGGAYQGSWNGTDQLTFPFFTTTAVFTKP